MAPAAQIPKSIYADPNSSNPVKRAWQEDRVDLYPSLHGRGQENTTTTRHALEERRDSRQKSPGRARHSARQNSLKRVKNSNEVLRQRSTRKTSKDLSDPLSTREGRHFTVANVGNNGKIYLRYLKTEATELRSLTKSIVQTIRSTLATSSNTDTSLSLECE